MMHGNCEKWSTNLCTSNIVPLKTQCGVGCQVEFFEGT